MINASCLRAQCNVTGEARTRGHSVSSQALSLPQERCDKVNWPSRHGRSCWLGDVKQQNKQNTNILANTKISASTKFAASTISASKNIAASAKFASGTKIPASTKFAAGTKIPASTKFAASTKIATVTKFAAGTNEPWNEISNNVICATSKGSDQPAHTRRLIRAFAWRLIIIWVLSYWSNLIWCF